MLLSEGLVQSAYHHAKNGRVYTAYGLVNAPVAFSTATGMGGPLLWNGSAINKTGPSVNAVLLSIGFGISVVSTVAGSLGITLGTGQAAAPTATTAIDTLINNFAGGPPPQCSLFRKGTVTNVGLGFSPIFLIGTGPLTVADSALMWQPLHGLYIVPPGCYASVAANVVLSTLQATIAIQWAEIPI